MKLPNVFVAVALVLARSASGGLAQAPARNALRGDLKGEGTSDASLHFEGDSLDVEVSEEWKNNPATKIKEWMNRANDYKKQLDNLKKSYEREKSKARDYYKHLKNVAKELSECKKSALADLPPSVPSPYASLHFEGDSLDVEVSGDSLDVEVSEEWKNNPATKIKEWMNRANDYKKRLDNVKKSYEREKSKARDYYKHLKNVAKELSECKKSALADLPPSGAL